MNTKPLTLFRLSIRNLKYNVIRSFGLVFIITVLSFSLFGNTVLSESLTNGLNSLSDRLGADIAIVPKEHTTDYKDALLTGEPSRFYFDKSIGEQIAKTEGVKRSTNQFLSPLYLRIVAPNPFKLSVMNLKRILLSNLGYRKCTTIP